MRSRGRLYTGARRQRGQEIAELVGGILVLVPIVLYLFDFAVVLMCSQLADQVAKAAARAAANQPTVGQADSAAQATADKYKKQAFITSLSLIAPTTNVPSGAQMGASCAYNKNDRVVVQLNMTVKLPVPLPFVNQNANFQAQAIEPIVTISQ